MLVVRFLKKGKRIKNVKRKKNTHLNILESDSQRGSHIWKQLLQLDSLYNEGYVCRALPSSSETSSISSTVSGKLMRCFSVVVYRRQKQVREPITDKTLCFNCESVSMWLSWPHSASIVSWGDSSISELLTMETVSSVTSLRTSITEM